MLFLDARFEQNRPKESTDFWGSLAEIRESSYSAMSLPVVSNLDRSSQEAGALDVSSVGNHKRGGVEGKLFRSRAKTGHTGVTAADGEQGLRSATEREPDVIVLDMMLPKLSGVDVLHALRKESKTATIPVLVLTSLPQMNAGTLIHEG